MLENAEKEQHYIPLRRVEPVPLRTCPKAPLPICQSSPLARLQIETSSGRSSQSENGTCHMRLDHVSHAANNS